MGLYPSVFSWAGVKHDQAKIEHCFREGDTQSLCGQVAYDIDLWYFGRDRQQCVQCLELHDTAVAQPEKADTINPPHYRNHPSGIECIQITEHMGFNLGNAVKYLWRADLKHDTPVEDLLKAIWYIKRELQRRGESI